MEIYSDTYCVYVHTNKTNGKKYVGQTVRGDNPKKRWGGGSGYVTQKYFYRAIQKYGWDGFEHEVIASNLTKEEADNFEILLIDKLKAYDNNFGYNCTLGGGGTSGYHISEASKEKQKTTMKKYYSNPEYIQRMRDVAPKREVYQFTTDGCFVAKYVSAMEAQRQTGIHNGDISKCAFGKVASKNGFIFLFQEDICEINNRVDRYNKSKKPKYESVVQLSVTGEYVATWSGPADAGKNLNLNYKNIHSVCRGLRKTCGGFKWMYLSDYSSLNKS